jgi:hypothetical protein
MLNENVKMCLEEPHLIKTYKPDQRNAEQLVHISTLSFSHFILHFFT